MLLRSLTLRVLHQGSKEKEVRQAEVAGAWASFPPACSAEVALWQPAQAASPSLVPSHGALSLFTGHWVQAAALLA